MTQHVLPARPRDASLRDALIEAGIALLTEGGPEGLTLRRAAARAGVSHAAPAHHFDGLAGLQTAIAARAFQRFTEAMTARRDAAPDTPTERLCAIGEGYLDFAASHGGLFHIMFACPDIDMRSADLMAASMGAYMVLRDGCLPFSGGQPDPALETAVWALVHGYAMLGFGTPQTRIVGEPTPPFRDALKTLLAGRRNPLAAPGDMG